MKNQFRLFGFYLTIICLVGCMNEYVANRKSREITYFRDHRTGLCFATWGSQILILTNVPCTKEVEDLLVNGRNNYK